VQLRTLVAQGLRVANRWSQIAQQLHSLHPTDPHWFVSILGVDPPAQGRGVGCALLKALLEHADQGNAPTYLETDRERNVGFYEARGFRIEAQISLLDVPIWCMRRPLPPRPD